MVKACNFIKKEALTKVFSWKFCEIFKNTYLTEHLWTTTSGHQNYVSVTCRRFTGNCNCNKHAHTNTHTHTHIYKYTKCDSPNKALTSIVIFCKAFLKLFCFNAQNPAPRHLYTYPIFLVSSNFRSLIFVANKYFFNSLR